MKVQRRFYTRSNTTNKPICIIQGELGYYPIVIDGDLSEAEIDSKLLKANEVYGNIPEDLDLAVGCSMLGWNIPLAEGISQGDTIFWMAGST